MAQQGASFTFIAWDTKHTCLGTLCDGCLTITLKSVTSLKTSFVRATLFVNGVATMKIITDDTDIITVSSILHHNGWDLITLYVT